MTGADKRYDEPPRVGRTRTWWHPLLARLLAWLLEDGYEVQPEVPVGAMPLQIDVLLVRRESGEVSPWAQHDLPELLPCLRRRTLIEFKGPTDALEAGDWELLMAYAFLYLQQETAALTNEELSLVFLAPVITEPFRQRLALRRLSLEAEVGEPGVYRIVGSMFDTWVIETDEMARRRQPILTLFSRVFLRDRGRIIRELQAAGHAPVLYYVAQQIQQFRQFGEEWIMQFPNVEELDKMEAELKRAFLAGCSLEERLEGLLPEERLAGLSPEERLAGLSPEERRRLKQLLDQDELDSPER